MNPYYDQDGITIYHGDCREVLPSLDRAALVLTDPPWGNAGDPIIEGNDRALALWGEVCPLLRADRLVAWLPIHADPRAWLAPLAGWPYLRGVYIRRAIPGYYGRVLMDGEMLHALGTWPQPRKGRMVIPGGLQITYVAADRVNGHPSPRSEYACNWLVKFWSDPDDLIIDPFAGSGTTLASALNLGRRAIGIEISERYCEIAARRLAQGVLDFAGSPDGCSLTRPAEGES